MKLFNHTNDWSETENLVWRQDSRVDRSTLSNAEGHVVEQHKRDNVTLVCGRDNVIVKNQDGWFSGVEFAVCWLFDRQESVMTCVIHCRATTRYTSLERKVKEWREGVRNVGHLDWSREGFFRLAVTLLWLVSVNQEVFRSVVTLGLAMVNLCTKPEVFIFTLSKFGKADAKFRK